MEVDDRRSKDTIYKQKKEQLLSTVSFLTALKENLDHDTAFKIASDAFTKFMTAYYENILSSYEKGSQERFDHFRKSYEQFSEKTPYCDIIDSSSTVLKVKYTRCPFFEVLKDQELENLAYTFCLSDPAFTEKVLPGVIFTRDHEIVTGGEYCDHTWNFSLKMK
ncbi:MAG: L-2-amino-thiazoline-4-carboxylic acid hydrolase [Candidatus Hodarchaeales archaeon]